MAQALAPEKQHPKPIHQEISDRKRRAFLAILAKTANPMKAAQAVGYADTTYLRKVRAQDGEFALAWEEAEKAGGDVLESEMVRRGVEGVEKEIWYKGEVVGTEMLYSDRLLELAVKGAKPDKYRDKHVKVEGELKGTFGISVLPAVAASSEAWADQADKVLDEHNKVIEAYEQEDGSEVIVPVKDGVEVKRS